MNQLKRLCINILLISILLSSGFPTHAQEGRSSLLRGSVKNGQGEPIEFASVKIKNTSNGVLTDHKGSFSFRAGFGKHILQISFTGYETVERQIEVEPNKPLTIDVKLKELISSLDEVVVTGRGKAEQLKVKGYAVNVIETQKIAVQSVQTNELLDRTAGVRVRQDGGMGSRVNYNINGLSGEAIKVFIDGVPTSNYGPTFSLNSIPPALIERIEVYKGVVPGHLSEDALGGAINIVLKQQVRKTLTMSYSYGSFNTHQWNAAGNYRWKNGLTFEGSAFYNYSDNNYKVWGKDIFFRSYDGTITESDGKKVKRFHDTYESLGGKFNFGYTNVKWADQFLLGAVLSKGYNEVQNGVTMQVVYGNRHNKRNSDVITFLYNKRDIFAKGLSLKVDATNSYLNRQVIDTIGIRYDWLGPIKKPDGSYLEYISGAEASRTKTAEKNQDYTNMARINLSYQINERHTLYTNYMLNDFERKISDAFQPLAMQKLRNTRDLQKSVLSFTYESLLFEDRLRTSLFYKHYFQKAISNEAKQSGTDFFVEEIEKKMDNSGYGLTVSYALLPNLHLLGSLEEAIRMPSAGEIFGNVADGSLVLSSFGLNPEKSMNANIGFNFGTYKTGAHSFNLNASFYYRDTKDMIKESYAVGNDISSQFKNLENVETKGIDTELNYNYADKLSLRLNASKFNILFNTKYDEFGHPYNYYRMQICNEPSFKFNGNVTYYRNNFLQRGSRTSVYYNINYVNSFLRSWSNVGSKNLDEVPAQLPMDLGLTYTFPKSKVIISFDAKNIFNQQVFDNFGLQKPGRAFFAKVTYYIL